MSGFNLQKNYILKKLHALIHSIS